MSEVDLEQIDCIMAGSVGLSRVSSVLERR
jgi:hypothetical protein